MCKTNENQPYDEALCSPQEVGKRLSIAMNLMKISPEQLALRLNTSTEKIMEIEQGKRPMPDSWLYTLATVFKIDAHWLATGVRPVKSATADALNELAELMPVPEVNGYINYHFQKAKRVFSDQVKKRIIPWRNK